MDDQIQVFLVGNDMVLQAGDIRDQVTNKIISGAVILATVYDESDTPLTSISWPVTLAEVSNLPGTYRYTLPGTLPVSDEQQLYAVVTLSSSKGNAKWKTPIRGLDRS